MKLSSEQQRAVELFVEALESGRKQFVIAGLAGTGKTTVIKALIDALDFRHTYEVCTPTGKAAHVLRTKGVEARTLHSLLYWPREKDQGDGVEFVGNDAPMPDVVIVDEASMLSARVVGDLLARIPFVCFVGDHGQLEPVITGDDEDPELMKHADFTLTQIHRQALGSPIITFAHRMREGLAPISTGPQAQVVRRAPKGMHEADVLLVARNATRVRLNQWVRRKRGYSGALPQLGEQVICLRNNTELRVFNGMTGKVVDLEEGRRGWFPRLTVETDAGLRESMPFMPEQFGREKTINDARLYRKNAPTLWDFGYCLTVHKCVGGDTLIETEQGWQRIDTVERESGRVLGRDLKLHPFTAFVSRKPEKVYELGCEYGYSLTATPDHRMQVWDGDKCTWVVREAEDIALGSFLRLRLGSAVKPRKPPALPPMPPVDCRARKIVVPGVLNEELAEFFGLMVSDGTVFKSGVRLAKRYTDVVQRFSYLLRECFGLEGRSLRIGETEAVEASSTALTSWLGQVGGMQPHCKDIPEVILRAPPELRARFLRGLFEDGTVNVKQGKVDHVELANRSLAFVKKVQTLLLEFEIVSSVAQRGKVACLYIYSDSVTRFKDRIGFVASAKNERLELPVTRPTRMRVPVGLDELRERGASESVMTNARSRGYVSRAAAQDLGLEAQLKFHYVRLRTREVREAETYCLHVPGMDSFLQNRFDGMNSQGSEWSSVVVYDEVPSNWDTSRWRYTAATRASKSLLWYIA